MMGDCDIIRRLVEIASDVEHAKTNSAGERRDRLTAVAGLLEYAIQNMRRNYA